MSYWFYLGYPQSTKTEMLSMLGSGHFLKIAKINSQQEKPISPNRKSKFPQNAKNSANPQKYTLAKISPHTRCFVREKVISFSLAIEHFHNAHITLRFPPSPKKGIVEIQFLSGNLSTPVKPPGEIGNIGCAKFFQRADKQG